MPGWTLVDTHPTQGRTFQRPLDATDLRYVWLGRFNGTGDGIWHAELRLVDDSQDAHLFSAANVVRAWLSTKRRYPIAAATVQQYSTSPGLNGARGAKAEDSDDGGGGGEKGMGPTSEYHFVVQERDLSVLRPGEIVFEEAASAEEVQQRVAAIYDGPRPLSENMLVKLYIFRETDPRRTNVIHVVAIAAHCIADVVACETLARCFLDTLSRGDSDSEPAHAPLEDRLAMFLPMVDLEPVHLRSLGPVIRRWRRAVGAVIFQLRWAKLQGGHTLPCHVTRMTPHVPARFGHIVTSLTAAQSAAVLANCRLCGITFGNAYLPLAQVAMTRVLYRRYLRGEISEEEWAYRIRQPHINVNPINLRPYLDKTWFSRGGGGELLSRIAAAYYQLPFMTLGGTTKSAQHRQYDQEHIPSDGAPPFSDLLTLDRFIHRAGLAKKQATAFFSHPLFFEIIHAASRMYFERARLIALQWMKRVETSSHNDAHESEGEILSLTDMPMVLAHGGSSVGNVDLMSPSEFPLPSTHPLSPYSSAPHPLKAGYTTQSLEPSPSTSEVDTTPKIVVEYSRIQVYPRPAELSLGASTRRGQLCLYAYYDGNVFGDSIVKEWLDEVREAVLWYLGQTHAQSGHARQNRSGKE